MLAQKWNVKTKKYESYELPKKATLCAYYMGEVIECAKCAKKITYGSGYTSRQIHTEYGLGFVVCPECHEKELKEDNLI